MEAALAEPSQIVSCESAGIDREIAANFTRKLQVMLLVADPADQLKATQHDQSRNFTLEVRRYAGYLAIALKPARNKLGDVRPFP